MSTKALRVYWTMHPNQRFLISKVWGSWVIQGVLSTRSLNALQLYESLTDTRYSVAVIERTGYLDNMTSEKRKEIVKRAAELIGMTEEAFLESLANDINEVYARGESLADYFEKTGVINLVIENGSLSYKVSGEESDVVAIGLKNSKALFDSLAEHKVIPSEKVPTILEAVRRILREVEARSTLPEALLTMEVVFIASYQTIASNLKVNLKFLLETEKSILKNYVGLKDKDIGGGRGLKLLETTPKGKEATDSFRKLISQIVAEALSGESPIHMLLVYWASFLDMMLLLRFQVGSKNYSRFLQSSLKRIEKLGTGKSSEEIWKS